MTSGQLVAKIRANSILLPHFKGEEGGICPYCVARAVALPEQEELEELLDTMVRCDFRMTEIDAQIFALTHNLREEREEHRDECRGAVRRLYELKNSNALSQTA